eukprot:CAMPEP_0172931898 /NCGR_PEP_ID=MMETSP1075-20121228/219724_1 /TAXON_ID=2916 /ORGANISM="Ceratium fusus, Strain PA161109" /LENGTH=328 /DNA_ID=CAMNT_0013793221 /DNA_START=64 /DNA_END=1049 /DNA_ORIENTATION=+
MVLIEANRPDDSCVKDIVTEQEALPPCVMDPYKDSGFVVQTEVKQSTVPGGGSGRYVLADVKKGQVVRITSLIGAAREAAAGHNHSMQQCKGTFRLLELQVMVVILEATRPDDSCVKDVIEEQQALPPWVMDPYKDSGFLVQTEVKQSSVPGGGSGRYVLEDVKKGQIVRMTTLIGPHEKPRPGTTLVTNNAKALLDCLNYKDVKGMPTNNEQIVHFAGTPFNVSEDNESVYHWAPFNCTNHSSDPNIVLALPPVEDGHLYLVALRDMQAGDELFHDYRADTLPSWFTGLCAEWNCVPAEYLGYQISGNEGFAKRNEDVSMAQWPGAV